MKSIKRIHGVTLLEIMLVLAIAAMVIVMSIRYYQSASTNQKINAAMGVITSMVAAGDSYLAATGTMPGSAADFTPYLPGQATPKSPWGTTVGGFAASAGTSYSFTITTSSAGDCAALKNSVTQNYKFSTSSCSGGVLTVTVTP